MKYNIGIIGGGQLGMMMCEAAKKLGLTTIVLDPSSDCPCSHVCDKLIVGSFNSLENLLELGEQSEVLSYEFENVKGDVLRKLDNKFNIKQGIMPLLDSQDRLREKDNANKHGLKTAKYFNISNYEDLNKAIENLGYPFIFKTRREGYDGHGQVVINNKEDLVKLDEYIGAVDAICEEKINFDFECSLILIRDKEKIIHFPISRNIHKQGILDLSIVPANIDKNLEERIIKKSEEFLISANYYGIITIEFFVKGNEFYFNEMAPRPHNSGHYTIEGCNVSQYSELVKFLTNKPLTEPKLLTNTVMKNILGKDLKNVDKFETIDNHFTHMYHKTVVKEFRKLGHITFTNMDLAAYLDYKKKLNIEE